MGKSGTSAVVTLAILVALAGGVAAGVALTPVPVPHDVQDASPLTLAPVGGLSYDDPRTVTLTVTAQEEQTLPSPRDGRVGLTACAVGGVVTSGESTFTIDGKGLLSLAMAAPPWRDLAIGSVGQDAAALNAELVRLGYSAPQSDTATKATMRAYDDAARQAGAEPSHRGVIRADQILWIPTAQVAIGRCPVRLGDTVTSGDTVLALQSMPSAKVSALPTDAVAGARVLTIDGTTIAIADDGTIADPTALAALLDTNAYATATPDESGGRQFAVRWSLAEPAEVLVVPPAAVAGLESGKTCVIDQNGKAYSVHVVGSQLGQTYVMPSSGVSVPAQVLSAPAGSAVCE